MLKNSVRADDEEDFDFFLGGGSTTRVVIEREPRPSEFIGLFDAGGDPIYRRYVDKPPIGFTPPEDKLYLYDLDPENDFYYTSDPDLPMDDDD